MTDDITEDELRAAKRRYQDTIATATVERDAVVLRARRAGWSLRQIGTVMDYSAEHVATMATRAERRERGHEPDTDQEDARALEGVA